MVEARILLGILRPKELRLSALDVIGGDEDRGDDLAQARVAHVLAKDILDPARGVLRLHEGSDSLKQMVGEDLRAVVDIHGNQVRRRELWLTLTVRSSEAAGQDAARR